MHIHFITHQHHNTVYNSTQPLHPAHLHDIVSRFDVCDVDPLAVDVVTVQIPAAHCDALIAKVGALIPLGNT